MIDESENSENSEVKEQLKRSCILARWEQDGEDHVIPGYAKLYRRF